MWTITPYSPSLRLTSLIQLYWIGHVRPGLNLPLAYLPPTGYIGVLLQYGERQLRLRNHGASWMEVSDAVVLGQYFRYLEVDIPASFEMIGVLVKPSVFHQYFGFSMDELTHRIIPADQVLGSGVSNLVEQLRNEQDALSKIKMVDDYFIDLFKCKKFATGIVDDAIRLINDNNGSSRMRALSDVLNCSPRLLQKKFKEITGVSPKYMGRVVQFNKMLNNLSTTPDLDWASLAIGSGYYDQSHLISAFVEFTGSSPVQYTQIDNDITKFYLDSYDSE